MLDDGDVVYIARAETKRIMSVTLSVGSRLPAYCTSMGRVLLASIPPGELDAYLEREALKAYTERTVTDTGASRKVIEQVRQRGHALVDQELEVALRSIAVPVRNASGAVVAAMNTSTPAPGRPPRDGGALPAGAAGCRRGGAEPTGRVKTPALFILSQAAP